jgi:integrase
LGWRPSTSLKAAPHLGQQGDSPESKREQLPTFGQEMALLDVCTGDRAHLRSVIIIASDSGLRKNELFTLSWKEKDIDFVNRLIRLRAINAKWNKGRTIPMTQRVYD